MDRDGTGWGKPVTLLSGPHPIRSQGLPQENVGIDEHKKPSKCFQQGSDLDGDLSQLFGFLWPPEQRTRRRLPALLALQTAITSSN